MRTVGVSSCLCWCHQDPVAAVRAETLHLFDQDVPSVTLAAPVLPAVCADSSAPDKEQSTGRGGGGGGGGGVGGVGGVHKMLCWRVGACAFAMGRCTAVD
jgi:hypothetical protein